VTGAGTVRFHNSLREQARHTEGRDPQPTAAIIDSQLRMTTPFGPTVLSLSSRERRNA
jgi:riboflavin biosynthesis pyrimidine reductase